MCVLSFQGKTQNVTQIEYFIDVDLGVGQNSLLNVSLPDTAIIENITVPIPGGISPGNHKLYLRSKDSNGNWSHTARRNIVIVEPTVQNNVVRGEYFFDSDPEVGLATPFNISPQDTNITQSFLSQVSPTASIGFHKVYGRVIDSLGNWSHTFRRNVEVVNNDDSLYVVEVEYFSEADSGFGNCQKLIVSIPVFDGCTTVNIPYPAGSYSLNDTIFIRVRDSSNLNWSHTSYIDSICSNCGPCYLNPFVNEVDSELQFAIYPNPSDATLNVSFKKHFDGVYSIMDILGKEYLSGEINEVNMQIGVAALSPGVYLLSIRNEKSAKVHKFIKQ